MRASFSRANSSNSFAVGWVTRLGNADGHQVSALPGKKTSEENSSYLLVPTKECDDWEKQGKLARWYGASRPVLSYRAGWGLGSRPTGRGVGRGHWTRVGD